MANNEENKRIVSEKEALEALRGISQLAETIADRRNTEPKETALLVIGQVGKTNGKVDITNVLIGNHLDIAYLIADAMKKDPAIIKLFKFALAILDSEDLLKKNETGRPATGTSLRT